MKLKNFLPQDLTPSEVAIVRSELFTSFKDLNFLIMLLELRAGYGLGIEL